MTTIVFSFFSPYGFDDFTWLVILPWCSIAVSFVVPIYALGKVISRCYTRSAFLKFQDCGLSHKRIISRVKIIIKQINKGNTMWCRHAVQASYPKKYESRNNNTIYPKNHNSIFFSLLNGTASLACSLIWPFSKSTPQQRKKRNQKLQSFGPKFTNETDRQRTGTLIYVVSGLFWKVCRNDYSFGWIILEKI